MTAKQSKMYELTPPLTSLALYGSQDPEYAYKQYKRHDMQDLQRWKDMSSEAVMTLESNIATMTSLRGFYDRL